MLAYARERPRRGTGHRLHRWLADGPATSAATSTVWTVWSQRTEAGPEVLPLLLVDYQADVDLTNTALHPRNRRGPATLALHLALSRVCARIVDQERRRYVFSLSVRVSRVVGRRSVA